MTARLESLIAEFRDRLKTALNSDNRDLANAYASMISGFRILLRMQNGPEVCAFDPSCFNGRHGG